MLTQPAQHSPDIRYEISLHAKNFLLPFPHSQHLHLVLMSRALPGLARRFDRAERRCVRIYLSLQATTLFRY